MKGDADPIRGLPDAFDLRWSLRDIHPRRWKLPPIKGAHIEKLLGMGLIEMQDEIPVLTDAGLCNRLIGVASLSI